VLLDAWIPAPRRLSRDAALRELGERYLRARGPATVDDLVHWTKLTKRDCTTALEPDGRRIVPVDGDGGPYRMLADHAAWLGADGDEIDRSVVALAAFDEHLLGYRVRDVVLDPAHANEVDPARHGVFRWTIAVGGRVVATWKRTRRARKTIAQVRPFAPVDEEARSRVPAAIGAWGAFTGEAVEVAWDG
jgi:hypothetical protein